MENTPPDQNKHPEIQIPKGEIIVDLRGKTPKLPKELGYNDSFEGFAVFFGVRESKYNPRELAKEIEGKDLVIKLPDRNILYLAKNIADEAARITKNPNDRGVTKFHIMQSLANSAIEGIIQQLGGPEPIKISFGKSR
mgnify:CR=1 FL=1